ncbi:MAG: hypothetical protein AAGE79_01730 [Acinetobacter pittii]
MNNQKVFIVEHQLPLINSIFHMDEKLDVNYFLKNINQIKTQEALISIFSNIKKENKCINFNFDIEKELNKFSFMNFIRYVNFLYPYFLNRRIDIEINNEILKIRLHTKYEDATLGILFKNDGSVDFTSLDRDQLIPNEKKLYVMKGSFSSSNLYSRSYKIKRLMALLNELDKEYELRRSIHETEEMLNLLKKMNKRDSSSKMKTLVKKIDTISFDKELNSLVKIYDEI